MIDRRFYLTNIETGKIEGQILATIRLKDKLHYVVSDGLSYIHFQVDDTAYRMETIEDGPIQVISANRSTPKKP